MTSEALVVAIDGPAASGKGTLARRIADHFGLAYLDTGLLYRAVGAKVLETSGDEFSTDEAVAAARSLGASDLQRTDLRTDRIAVAASRVAVIADVRSSLLDFQRTFAEQPPNSAPGAVLDGRDIGSVVCPDASIKLYIVASDTIRAKRRLRELQERGLEAIHADVLRDLRERDFRDASRDVAPLKPPEDAVIIDTTRLDPDGVFQIALQTMMARHPFLENWPTNR